MSAHNPKATVFETRATNALLGILRCKDTPQPLFARAADRLCRIVAEEALASMASEPYEIETPCGRAVCKDRYVEESQVVVVDVMRSGAILMEAVRRLAPSAKTAKILIQRDEATALPHLLYSKLPPNIRECFILLCDPMLATGGSSLAAIDVLRKAGVQEHQILFANIVCCPEGLRRLATEAPDVRIVTTAVDEKLNAQAFIVPGLGDFGDRYFGTAGYDEGFWGPSSTTP